MKRSKALIKSIRLVDWCLIIIMSLLLLQSIYNLFANEVVNSEENIIDVVIRTAAASIFGYFMSANFMSGKSEAVFQPFRQNPTQSVAKPTFRESSVQNTIGFTANPKPSDNLQKESTTTFAGSQSSKGTKGSSDAQIIIITAIGVISLISLILVRNFVPLSSGMTATVSQLRDFVSGCVGFLIGSNAYSKK